MTPIGVARAGAPVRGRLVTLARAGGAALLGAEGAHTREARFALARAATDCGAFVPLALPPPHEMAGQWLARRADALSALLDLVDGCEEVIATLRVPVLLAEEPAPGGAGWLRARAASLRALSGARAGAERGCAAIADDLGPLARATLVRGFARAGEGGADLCVLAPRGTRAALIARLGDLAGAQTVSGPWPVYSFVAGPLAAQEA
jgi:hypothetical protein